MVFHTFGANMQHNQCFFCFFLHFGPPEAPMGSLGLPWASPLGPTLENHDKLKVLHEQTGQKCRACALD